MKILFYSDGSNQAERAVRFGAPIAAACRAEAFIIGIAEQASREKPLLRAMRRAKEICKEHGLDAELIAKVGKPRRELVQHTRETHYDLVVMGGLRQNPLWSVLNPLWKSVRAYKIIESIEPHALIVFGHRTELRRMLLCTNGRDSFDQAVEFAGGVAQAVQATVDLFHVMPKMPPVYANLIRLEEHVERVLESNSKLGRTLSRQKDLLTKLGVFGEVRLRHGLLMPELEKELRRGDYDLVVSGSSPAKEKVSRYMLGDLTREIVNHAEQPVLVVRTGQQTFWGLFKELLGINKAGAAPKGGGESG